MANSTALHHVLSTMSLSEMDPKFLECRYTRHAWRRIGQYRWDHNKRVLVLVCRDCGTEREQVLTSRGEVKSNSYTYPEGYLAKKRGKAIAAIDVRQEILRRSEISANYEAFQAGVQSQRVGRRKLAAVR